MTVIQRPTAPIPVTSPALAEHMARHGHQVTLTGQPRQQPPSDLDYRPFYLAGPTRA